MVDLAGHVGYVFLFLGQLAIARGHRSGWALRFVGEAMWIAICWHLHLSSGVLWGAAFLCIDLMGVLRDRSDRRHH